MIRKLFESYIVHSSNLIFEDLADEFYLQLYRQCNFDTPHLKELLKPIFLVMAFLSRYMIPSEKLIKLYEVWLLRKKESFQSMEKHIKLVMVNFKIVSTLEQPDKGLYVCWPPSVSEIQALDLGKVMKVKVLYPGGESREYEVDEATTVESLMRDKIFNNEKFFKGHVEN